MSGLMEQVESVHRTKTTLYADWHQENLQHQHNLVVLPTSRRCESFSENFLPVQPKNLIMASISTNLPHCISRSPTQLKLVCWYFSFLPQLVRQWFQVVCNTPSVRSLILDEEKMRQSQWLGLVLCIPLTSMTLTAGLQEGYLAH